MTQQPERSSWMEDAIAYCLARVRENLIRLDAFPDYTQGDKWITVADGGSVGGYWVGLLWLAYVHTKDAALEAAARAWAARLTPRSTDSTTHELGSLFELSHVLGARITGDASLKEPALQAAATLARRVNQRGGYLQASGDPDASGELRGRSVIEAMASVGLLYWAGQETGNSQYVRSATQHARTARTYQVRTNFSTAQVADFDPDMGAFRKQDTCDGLNAASCWSRGQAIALHGFATAYGWSRDPSFRETARGLAEYTLLMSPDRVPYWDYNSPAIPRDVRDSSAAAISASGLLNLAALETDDRASLATRWRSHATRTLQTLWLNYSSQGASEPSILLHGTASKPRGKTDTGLIYGDYYFVEGLTRLMGMW